MKSEFTENESLVESYCIVGSSTKSPKYELGREVGQESWIAEIEDHWRSIANFNVNNTIPVSFHVSSRSGMRAYVTETEGPIVSGSIVLATESMNTDYADVLDGLPYIVQHLILAEPEDLLQKGFLGRKIHRAIGLSVQSYVNTDRTVFSFKTAEAEGFYNAITAILSRILCPKFSQYTYDHEIGYPCEYCKCSGSLYASISDKNSNAIHCEIALQSLLHGSYSPYAAPVYGNPNRLSEIDIDSLARYHRSYYRPDNLCLIVSGKININMLLHTLENIETSILDRIHMLTSISRPWWPKIEIEDEGHENDILVQLCGDSGCEATVMMGTKLPMDIDLQDVSALNILWLYLTDSQGGPLLQAFLDGNEPLCDEMVYKVVEGRPGWHGIYFTNCSVPRIQEFRQTFLNAIDPVLRNGGVGFNLKKLQTIINNEVVKNRCAMENCPHDKLSDEFVKHFLFAHRSADGPEKEGTDLRNRIQNAISRYTVLPTVGPEASQYWLNLAVTYLDPQNLKVAMACTDVNCEDKEGTVSRASDPPNVPQKSSLTYHIANPLDDDQPINANLLEIPSIQLATLSSGLANILCIDDDDFRAKVLSDFQHLDEMGFSGVQFDHMTSSFWTISAWLDTSSLPPILRMHIPLLLELLFCCNIEGVDDCSLISRETVEFGASLGVLKECTQGVRVSVCVEEGKYERAVFWLHAVLNKSVFTKECLMSATERVLSKSSHLEDDGKALAQCTMDLMTFDLDNCNVCASSPLRQTPQIARTKRRLERSPSEVILEIQALLSHLIEPSHMTLHVVGNFNTNSDITGPWKKLFKFSLEKDKFLPIRIPIIPIRGLRTQEAINPVGRGLLVTLENLQTQRILICAPCELTLDHKDFPTLLIGAEYLTKSPFERKLGPNGEPVRHFVSVNIECGMLYAEISCLNMSAEETYVKFQHWAQMIFGPKSLGLDEALFEASRATVAIQVLDQVSSAIQVSSRSILKYLKGDGSIIDSELSKQIINSTSLQVLGVMRTYLTLLFDPTRTTMAIVSSRNIAQQTRAEFLKLGLSSLDITTPELLYSSLATFGRRHVQDDTSSSSCASSVNSENVDLLESRSGHAMETGISPGWLRVASRGGLSLGVLALGAAAGILFKARRSR